MKFGYAWTFVNKPRGETPAPPPEKRAPALPRRRLARGIRIGPPHPNGLVSPCWGASEFGSDILNGRLRPFPAYHTECSRTVSRRPKARSGTVHLCSILYLKNQFISRKHLLCLMRTW